jgi:hypothetical protein
MDKQLRAKSRNQSQSGSVSINISDGPYQQARVIAEAHHLPVEEVKKSSLLHSLNNSRLGRTSVNGRRAVIG